MRLRKGTRVRSQMEVPLRRTRLDKHDNRRQGRVATSGGYVAAGNLDASAEAAAQSIGRLLRTICSQVSPLLEEC